jgi:hypothetical protein
MIQLYGNTMASFNDQIMGANSFRSPRNANATTSSKQTDDDFGTRMVRHSGSRHNASGGSQAIKVEYVLRG